MQRVPWGVVAVGFFSGTPSRMACWVPRGERGWGSTESALEEGWSGKGSGGLGEKRCPSDQQGPESRDELQRELQGALAECARLREENYCTTAGASRFTGLCAATGCRSPPVSSEPAQRATAGGCVRRLALGARRSGSACGLAGGPFPGPLPGARGRLRRALGEQGWEVGVFARLPVGVEQGLLRQAAGEMRGVRAPGVAAADRRGHTRSPGRQAHGRCVPATSG